VKKKKKKKKKKLKLLHPHYSGPLSREFWRRVNTLPPLRREAVYWAAVLLQNAEESVLHWLNLAEQFASEEVE
jgi:hypothetical protein